MNDAKNTPIQRLLYMLLFGVILYIAGTVVFALVALQFIFTLMSNDNNDEMRRLGRSIGVFFKQALDFLTYNSEVKPFPFSPWPTDTDDSLEQSNDASQTNNHNTTENGAAEHSNAESEIIPAPQQKSEADNTQGAEDAVIVDGQSDSGPKPSADNK